jgi:uncharacterized protein (DUF3820 family)
MICTDILNLVPQYVQDWQTLVIMSTVCKNWKNAVTNYAGDNFVVPFGKYRGARVYHLIVCHPNYVDFMVNKSGMGLFEKVFSTIQPKCDVRYMLMSFGKYKGQYLRNVPLQYRQWLLRHRMYDKYMRAGFVKLLHHSTYWR